MPNTRLQKKKRDLSPEEPSPKNQEKERRTSKKQKVAKMTAQDIADLKNLITNSNEFVSNKIDVSQAALESKVNDWGTQLNQEVSQLKTSVDDFRGKVEANIASISSNLQSHSQRLDNVEDDIQRVRLCQDLRLTGVSPTENENILEIFRKVATEIGFVIDNNTMMPTLERKQFKNKTTNQLMPSHTIIIHFATASQKQSFYSLYLHKMPLDPAKLGLNQTNGVFIGENLTSVNATVFRRAKAMKREQKIAQVFTEDGIVHVRLVKGQALHVIRNVTSLEILVAQHGQIAPADIATANGLSNENNIVNNSNNTADNSTTNGNGNGNNSNSVDNMEH